MISFPLTSSPWRVRDCAGQSWLPAIVPGCVHRDLLRAGRIPDPFFGTNELDLAWIDEREWEYRTSFHVPPDVLAEDVIELAADGLDTVATVTLNGQEVARTENMFIGYRWNVKALLRSGTNDLRIRFGSTMDYVRKTRANFVPPREINDPVGGCVRIRKEQCQFGWDWGPRLITAGIWRDLRLEAWSVNQLRDVRIEQQHRGGAVKLKLAPEFARAPRGLRVTAVLSRDGVEVARGASGATPSALTLAVPHPELWWPAGQGAQPLYDLEVFATHDTGREIGRVRRRLGLRTLKLDRARDTWGESFQFVVNGRAVFCKGANWIPAHSFVAGLTRTDYERDLRAAASANMNAIRVWGGGIYESEHFYDLCDELGLLVWQDFMFACTLYPADRAFVASVREEAEYQVARLRHRACLALWCGNNEMPMINRSLVDDRAFRRDYEKIFHGVLPDVVKALDPHTPYWPSSPWRGALDRNAHTDGERAGDTHYWDVWHARHPVKDYENWAFRFVSEFGMQSYSSRATNATFCPPHDDNVFGPAMENHQKNRAGNQIILDYVSRRYRFPSSQDGLIYLSQLNQAHCVQTGVEHYRRLMPRCMGAMYWQLNDCWPVASWSSIEFTGRWKALHYAARRFFAPALASVHIPGDEKPKIGNYRDTTVTEAHLYTVYDAPQPAAGRLVWELWHLDGRRVLQGQQRVRLRPGASVRERVLDLRGPMQRHGRDHLYLRLQLEIGGAIVSEQTAFLSPPRFLALPRAQPTSEVRSLSDREFELTLRSPHFLHAVEIDLGDTPHTLSDNFFDLYPGVPRTIRLTLSQPAEPTVVSGRLTCRSLADVCS